MTITLTHEEILVVLKEHFKTLTVQEISWEYDVELEDSNGNKVTYLSASITIPRDL